MDLKRKMRDKRHRVLLGLAKRGNEDAFRRLYQELYLPVSRFVQRRVPCLEDAEDITAQVFATFVQRLDSYDGSRGSVMTWVVFMARNRVIDSYRRNRPATESVDELAEVLAGGQSTQLQSLIKDEEMLEVQLVLDRQPAEIREMFALRFEQGLRVREVAEIMGLSPDAAKQRFARTIRRIQKQLKEEQTDICQENGDSPCTAID